MNIVFYNKKGGVGKTSLAYNVARDLGFFLISNDDSIIETAYEGQAKIMPKIKLIENQNIVYDLGGFTDPNVVDILKAADMVVIPTIADINSLKRTVNSMKEVAVFTKNIMIIGNIVKQKDQEFIAEYVNAEFFIRESKIFQKSFIEQKSITEIFNESKLHQYRYRNIYKEYESLLKHLKDLGGLI